MHDKYKGTTKKKKVVTSKPEAKKWNEETGKKLYVGVGTSVGGWQAKGVEGWIQCK
jgi:hypothetical protein